MRKKRVYLDHAATTPLSKEVLKAMLPFYQKKFGNPSSLHFFGQETSAEIEKVREKTADLIQAKPEEIIFTSSGSEANNQALKGVAFACQEKGKHLIISSIEHKSILESAYFLEKQGFEVTYLPVDRQGLVNPDDLKKSLKKETILVSIMMANNEIGTIEPVEELVRVVKENSKAYFHTDAVQAAPHLEISVKDLNIDLLSVSAHKFYGPKGAGLLYANQKVPLLPLIHGGEQESGRRAGTHNVPGIIGLSKAFSLAQKEKKKEAKRLTRLRDYLIDKTLSRLPEVILNGPIKNRLPNNASFSFHGLEAEAILIRLDLRGIAASSGSACSSSSIETSHVLKAIGLSPEWARGTVRFSLGRSTTQMDLDYLLSVLEETISSLRKISPLKKAAN